MPGGDDCLFLACAADALQTEGARSAHPRGGVRRAGARRAWSLTTLSDIRLISFTKCLHVRIEPVAIRGEPETRVTSLYCQRCQLLWPRDQITLVQVQDPAGAFILELCRRCWVEV